MSVHDIGDKTRQTFHMGIACDLASYISRAQLAGGAVAPPIERATPGEKVPGSIPALAACSLLVGSVSAETEVMISRLCLVCGST